METHYVCTGTCGALSLAAGACTNEACPRYNLDFTECACEDGEHRQVMSDSVKPNDLADETKLDLDEVELAEWENRFDEGEYDLK